MKHLLTLADAPVPLILQWINRANTFKTLLRTQNNPHLLPQPAHRRTLAIMFNKRSTRTRVAAETAFSQLGGHPFFLSPSDIQLGVNESLRDTSTVLGSMTDMILLRCHLHEDAEMVAKFAGVPVVNALTDMYHPTQILADIQTMHSAFGASGTHSSEMTAGSLRGLKVAWIGDTNNVLHSMLVTLPRLGIHLHVATPNGYTLNPRVHARMHQVLSTHELALVKWTHVPEEAVQDVDVVVTDTWVSMGMEQEKQKRLRDFEGFQVTRALMERGGARPGWKLMHCLPRKQEEVSDDVFYDRERSLVFEEAECRKYTMMAVFEHFLQASTSSNGVASPK